VSRGDALGLLETSSIAAGVRVADEVLKAARVELLDAVPVSPGKFLVVFAGDVAAVEASLATGRRFAEDHLLDELLLPRVHPGVAPAIARRAPASVEPGSALGIVETLSVASAIVGADAAAKAAAVRLLEIAPGRGIGGKGFFTMAGDVAAVQAAAAAAETLAGARGYHLRTEVLAGPHPGIAERVARRLLREPELSRFPGEEDAE
jgi:microcompartment protein CcmL/EutN